MTGDRGVSVAVPDVRGVRFFQWRQGLQCFTSPDPRRMDDPQQTIGRASNPTTSKVTCPLHPWTRSIPRDGTLYRGHATKALTTWINTITNTIIYLLFTSIPHSLSLLLTLTQLCPLAGPLEYLTLIDLIHSPPYSDPLPPLEGAHGLVRFIYRSNLAFCQSIHAGL